jgi:hypothetical protein
VIAPILTPDGMFSWNTVGSPLGLYNFDVSATNPVGTSAGRLSVNLVHQSAPVFYVSNETAGRDPGLLDGAVAPNSSGILHIWVDTDVRLCGVSLDLVETGHAIKFTDLNVYNPRVRWTFLDGPQEVTDSAVNHIGGASLKIGLSGDGIGPGTPDGGRVLLASVAYTAANTPGAKSDLSLRVGGNGINDITGNFSEIRFGTRSAPLVNGFDIGTLGLVGSITIVPEPSTGVLLLLSLMCCPITIRNRMLCA